MSEFNLNEAQKSQIQNYVDEGLKYGLKTIQSEDEIDKAQVEESVKFFYKTCLNIETPVTVRYAKSFKEGFELLRSIANDEVSSTNYPIYMTQEDMHWTQNYKFFVDMFPEKFDTEFVKETFSKKWITFTRNVYALILGQNEVISISYPTSYSFDSENRLHNMEGPAISYVDGSALYFIDGINVPEFVVMKPVNEVTKEDILSITNVDVRRCLIKRLGGANTIKVLGATIIDEKTLGVGGHYQLLGVDLEDGQGMYPYLKMINQSINEIHIEGVGELGNPSAIKTVEDALAFRNQMVSYEQPEYLS